MPNVQEALLELRAGRQPTFYDFRKFGPAELGAALVALWHFQRELPEHFWPDIESTLSGYGLAIDRRNLLKKGSSVSAWFEVDQALCKRAMPQSDLLINACYELRESIPNQTLVLIGAFLMLSY